VPDIIAIKVAVSLSEGRRGPAAELPGSSSSPQAVASLSLSAGSTVTPAVGPGPAH
jgi:hypothetical protein